MFHTIVSIKNDGHYFCRAGGNRPDGLNEPVTNNCASVINDTQQNESVYLGTYNPDDARRAAGIGWLFVYFRMAINVGLSWQ
ncbi:hypothetical protein NCTC86R_1570001 [Escherichia coli]|nr:hypothetical protein NCTC86R_1570001 [Escherichia coli]SOQ90692.1 hypothetical protein NC86S1_200002 [Escherichia coli]